MGRKCGSQDTERTPVYEECVYSGGSGDWLNGLRRTADAGGRDTSSASNWDSLDLAQQRCYVMV